MVVVDINEYKIKKHFKQISLIINQIVELKHLIKIKTPGCKINYQDYLANSPPGVNTCLLELLLEIQNQRIQSLIELKKREHKLKKILHENSQKLGKICRCEYASDYIIR